MLNKKFSIQFKSWDSPTSKSHFFYIRFLKKVPVRNWDSFSVGEFHSCYLCKSSNVGWKFNYKLTILLFLSAFQAKFLKRWAVAFRNVSNGDSSWPTMIGMNPAKEQRKLLMAALPKVRLVSATTAYLRTSVQGFRFWPDEDSNSWPLREPWQPCASRSTYEIQWLEIKM